MKGIKSADLETTIRTAIAVAKRYHELTGKPLGITGEVGEVLAADLLGLELAEARQEGYDAVGPDGRRVQIKARCIQPDRDKSPRMSGIRLDKTWDTVALIIMNEAFEPQAVYEAERKAIAKAIKSPGSKARNERGALPVSKFKAIGTLRWSNE
jgi:hypothetical protein